MEKQLIIAVDGHSSCGKSTYAKMIAKLLRYKYIDSGAMYRAFTLYCLRKGIFINEVPNEKEIISLLKTFTVAFYYNPEKGTNETLMNGENIEEEIRTNPEVADHVSYISTLPEVRERMVSLQREMGQARGIVMDGRDIGTTVFPAAEIKIFLTASVQIRAERRYKELLEKGQQVEYAEIEKNIAKRDYIDSNREVSPLRKAEDAIVLDNSNMTPDDQMQWFEETFHQKLKL